MEEGITIEEACETNVIGTSEDFEQNCNPDGTVKEQQQTTTFNLKDDLSNSVTIQNSHLYIGIALLAVVIVFGMTMAFKKLVKRKTS